MVAETEFPVQLSLQAAITHRLDTDMGPGNIYALQARKACQEWADGAEPMRVSRVNFFLSYSHSTYLDRGGVHFIRFFLSAVRAVAARCKLPFCPPPKPVPRCEAHQGNKRKTKGRTKKTVPRVLLLACGCHEGGRG